MSRYPQHQLIYSDLLRRLQSGEWKIGEKFPTPKELMGEYKFSHCTLFKAIQLLVDADYLSVRKGVGCFVTRVSPLQNIGLLMNEACLHPQKSPFPYVLREKLVSALEAQGFSVIHYIERKGDEFGGRVDIENLSGALKNHLLRGIVMAYCDFPHFMNECPIWQEYAVPYAKIGESGQAAFKVLFDIESCFQTVFRYFSERGRKNVGLICDREALTFAEKFLPSFPELHIRPEWALSFSALTNPERSGFRLMTQLWNQKERPNALYVSDDIGTKGVVQAALQLGIRIPEDLLIIHGANSDTNIFYPVRMPIIEYSLDDIAEKAIAVLENSIANFNSNPKMNSATEIVTPKLVETTNDIECEVAVNS